MLSAEVLEKVKAQVAELEGEARFSYPLAERLSWLYVILDHNMVAGAVGDAMEKHAEKEWCLSDDLSTCPQGGQPPEFANAAALIGPSKALSVVGRWLESVKVTCPKEYADLMAELGVSGG